MTDPQYNYPNLLDQYVQVRARIARLSKDMQALQEQAEALERTLLLHAQPITAELASAEFVYIDKPGKEVNWFILHDHIRATGDFDLLQNRLGAGVKARWEAAEDVPGVERVPTLVMKVRKV